LTLWKKNWLKREAAKNKAGTYLFRELKEEITVMRKQGEPPAKDPQSFAQYMCDLCSTPHAISELRQCVLCGRWACSSCWNQEHYLCSSCSGILKLHTISCGDSAVSEKK
jgi:hypothetical protein